MVGGAYAGKRKIVRQRYGAVNWLSAYEGDDIVGWNTAPKGMLVLEGWEVWIKQELQTGKNMEKVKHTLFSLVNQMATSKREFICIILETGRGIVPMEKVDRDLRDLLGWLLQKMAAEADEVIYCWHGLAKTIK